MLVKTKGIVFSHIKFKETSVIAKIYTEEYGLQSYIINGVRSKKSKIGLGLFQPLTLLDLVVYHKENKSLKRLSEVKCLLPFRSIPFDFRKSSVALFLSELLGKSVQEESEDKSLFAYIYSAIEYLDDSDFNPDYHLWFLVKLSHFLGFGPSEATDIVTLNSPNYHSFQELLSRESPEKVCSSNSQRRRMLDLLIKFYAGNLENFGELKSLKVLNEIAEN